MAEFVYIDSDFMLGGMRFASDWPETELLFKLILECIMSIKKLIASLSVSAVAVASGQAMALTLPADTYYTYGNANSYSLPILANYYDIATNTGTGPGNPFYVNSTAGQIKDQVVIYTGSSGDGVTTNAAGFDNAYGVPNGKPPYASIGQEIGITDPGNKAGIANNNTLTWDANLLNLKGFLDGGQALFLFNNNDTRQDENLAAWAKLWLTDSAGGLYGHYLYFSNVGAAYGAGGIPNNMLGTASTDFGNIAGPTIGNLQSTDMVLSGGDLCVNAAGNVLHAGACVPGDGGVKTIKHNIGADQAAYAIDVPLLNQWLSALFGLTDDVLGGYTLHMDLRLGCSAGWNDCTNIAIDNGYEQLFLVSTNSDFSVPEPSSLVLAGLALLALGSRRTRNRK